MLPPAYRTILPYAHRSPPPHIRKTSTSHILSFSALSSISSAITKFLKRRLHTRNIMGTCLSFSYSIQYPLVYYYCQKLDLQRSSPNATSSVALLPEVPLAHLPTLVDAEWPQRGAGQSAARLDLLDHLHPLYHVPEDHVPSVEVIRTLPGLPKVVGSATLEVAHSSPRGSSWVLSGPISTCISPLEREPQSSEARPQEAQGSELGRCSGAQVILCPCCGAS